MSTEVYATLINHHAKRIPQSDQRELIGNPTPEAYLDVDSDTTANRNPSARRKCTTLLNWGSLFGVNER